MTNKTIKPFYIRGLTRKEQIMVVTKSVKAGATLAPNSEAIYWVMGITVFNAGCYGVALHHLLKYKHLCDKFIEEI